MRRRSLATASVVLAVLGTSTVLAPTLAATAGTGGGSPGAKFRHTDLAAISALAPDDVWAVGATSDLTQGIVEHWDGDSWSRTRIACGCQLRGVDAISSDDVWAVGFGATGIALEHWDGSRWSSAAAPSGLRRPQLLSVSAASRDDVWAAGDYIHGGTFHSLMLHWDGSAWTRVRVPSGSGQRTLHALTSVSATWASDAVTVGNVSTGKPIIYRWDGSKWSRSDQLDKYDVLDDVSSAAPDDIWTVGADREGGDVTAHWDGSTWSTVGDAQLGVRTGLFAVVTLAGSDAWAGGYAAKDSQGETFGTLLEHWDGSTWTRVTSPNPFASMSANEVVGLAATSTDDVWAVGDADNGTDHSHGFVLHWDGNSWSS